MNFDALNKGLTSLSLYALKNQCCIHVARIGYGLVNFDWYCVERLLRKIFVHPKIPTYVYYYRKKPFRRQSDSSRRDSSTVEMSNGSLVSRNEQTGNESQKCLLNTFDGLKFNLGCLNFEKAEKFERYLVALGASCTYLHASGGITVLNHDESSCKVNIYRNTT